MPYVVLKAMTYKGVDLKPGDPLGDDHPKRSLVTCKRVKWEDEEGAPEPLAKVGDPSVDHYVKPLPAPEPIEGPEPQETEEQPAIELITVPTLEEVLAAGYEPDAAASIVAEEEKRLAAQIEALAEPAETAQEPVEEPAIELEPVEPLPVPKAGDWLGMGDAPEPGPPQEKSDTPVPEPGDYLGIEPTAEDAASVGLLVDDAPEPAPEQKPPKSKPRKKTKRGRPRKG